MLALNEVANALSFLLKPKRRTSTGEPSWKASVEALAPAVYAERILLAAMLAAPAAARVLQPPIPVPPPAPIVLEEVVVRAAFNYFYVLRAFSLVRRISSTV